jgi:succinate dehydrogenase/fumarate reductase flavoprotein subunit
MEVVMSTHESRQDKEGTNDFGKISIEKQKKLSRQRMNKDVSVTTNEKVAEEAIKRLDEKRAHPEEFEGET